MFFMNILLLFFALPIATIILSIVLQKLLKSPVLVAATFFAIYIIITFAFFDASFLVYAIAYTILAYITAAIIQAICKFIKHCCNNNEDNNDNENDSDNNCCCNFQERYVGNIALDSGINSNVYKNDNYRFQNCMRNNKRY